MQQKHMLPLLRINNLTNILDGHVPMYRQFLLRELMSSHQGTNCNWCFRKLMHARQCPNSRQQIMPILRSKSAFFFFNENHFSKFNLGKKIQNCMGELESNNLLRKSGPH